MKSKIGSLIFLILCVFSLNAQYKNLPDTLKMVRVKVHMVHDGDSFLAKNGMAYRIASVDAPEVTSPWNPKVQPYGKQARLFLDSLIDDKTVFVDSLSANQWVDGWGRRIGDVYFIENGRLNLVSFKLVQAGLAWYYPSKRRTKSTIPAQLSKAVNNSKKKKTGLWKDSNPVNPGQ